MTVSESAVNEALKTEDIESVIEAGAPDDEYASEAQSIIEALAAIDEGAVSEEALAELIRSIWSRSFGPFYEEDLEKRMPAFRQVAHQVLAPSSSFPHSTDRQSAST